MSEHFSAAAPAPAGRAFADLDPDAVLQALHLAGLEGDGRLLQLNSYENRVWQAHLDDGRVVVAKFYRPGRWTDAQIHEEHAFAQALAEQDVPVVAPLRLVPAWASDDLRVDVRCPSLAHVRTGGGGVYRLAVSERRVGHAPELESAEVMARLGRLVGRMHRVGRQATFQHRRPLSAQTLGHAARQQLIDSGVVHPDTESAWLRASAEALACVEAQFERLTPASVRLHGDMHPGNVLWRDEGQHAGPNVVDLDDCGAGPAIQDLWMLLPGEREAVEASLYHLLDGYRDVMPFDDRELLLIEPLRTLRMIHHSAWIARRWGDPAFPVAFPWFASPAYWQQQATELWEQVERMRSVGSESGF